MDFNRRQYDPQLGRFLGIDPMAAAGGQEVYSPYAAMGNAPESLVDPNGELPVSMGVTPWVRPTPQIPVGNARNNGPGSDREADLATGMMRLEMEARAAFMERMQEQEENDAFFETMAGRDFIGNGIADAGCDHSVTSVEEGGGSATGDEPNDEEPVKVVDNKGQLFNNVFDNITYMEGDNVFYILAHGSFDRIEDQSGDKTVKMKTAEQFDEQMAMRSPAYKSAIEANQAFTLWLYACTSYDMARKISIAHPNATIIGTSGVALFGYYKGVPSLLGIKDNKLDVNYSRGYFVAYQNGKEAFQLPILHNIQFTGNKK